MYKNIRDELIKLKGKKVNVVIDEGRSRKRKEKALVKGIYENIILVEINGLNESFSYSDVICKTIVFKNI